MRNWYLLVTLFMNVCKSIGLTVLFFFITTQIMVELGASVSKEGISRLLGWQYAFAPALLSLNISIINPTDEDLYLARYRIYVTADGKEFFLLDKAENTPVFAGDDNPMDLKLSVNPLTSIGLAFKKFKGKPIDYEFEGYIWLDYRGLEIPIPVKGHKRIAL